MFWPTHAVARMVGTHWLRLFRQSVFGRLAGYEDVNDAERLRYDPTMHWMVDGKAAQRSGLRRVRWALRDAMARGAQELRCSCRPVWPVDRPCARPKATRGIVLAAHVGSAKRPHNRTNEVAGGSSSECARSVAVCAGAPQVRRDSR